MFEKVVEGKKVMQMYDKKGEEMRRDIRKDG